MDSQSSSPRRCSSALSERALRKNNGTLAVASTNGGTLPTRKRAYSVFPSIAPPLDDPVDGAAVHDSDDTDEVANNDDDDIDDLPAAAEEENEEEADDDDEDTASFCTYCLDGWFIDDLDEDTSATDTLAIVEFVDKIIDNLEDNLAPIVSPEHIALNTKLLRILKVRNNFPVRQRKKILELCKVYDDCSESSFYHYYTVRPQNFLTELSNDIHAMVTDQRAGDDYHGLDAARDTIAQVRTAIVFFPEVLSKLNTIKWNFVDNVWYDAEDEDNLPECDDENREDEYPIHCVMKRLDSNNQWSINVDALSFVHLFAHLAIYYGAFNDVVDYDNRGGLMVPDEVGILGFTPLHWLAGLREFGWEGSDQDRIFVNALCRAELVQLKTMELFTKNDILQYDLIQNVVSNDQICTVQTFRFLTEWCPEGLLRHEEDMMFPLHYAAERFNGIFEVCFDACIRFYPHMKGICLLFQKNNQPYPNRNTTPFELAVKYNYDDEAEVMLEFIEEILGRYSGTTPIDTMQALLLAATDTTIHLDGVYFLLRREPTIVLRSS